jgi:hypothetical protein
MALSPYGLCGIDASMTKRDHAGALKSEDIRNISLSESKLLINGSVVAVLNSAEMAGLLADSLKKIASAHVSSRALLIEDFLDTAFETDAIRALYFVFKNTTFFLRILSAALFVHLFFVVPVSVYGGFFGKIWLQLLVIFLVLMLSIVINYYRAHVILFGASRAGLLSNLIMMLFSPPLAIRSVDFLSKNLLYRYHPLAVASVLLDGDDFRTLSHRFIRELRFPKFQVREAEADRIIGWYNDTVFQVISKRFGDLKTEDAYKPPVREDDSIVAYCPRCHCQYTRNGTCSDCGIGLAKYGA